MFGVTQGGGVFAQPRHFHAGGGGSQGEALAQRAGEGRIFAQARVEQGKAGAGEKGRLTGIHWPARPARKRPLNGLILRRRRRRRLRARGSTRLWSGRIVGVEKSG